MSFVSTIPLAVVTEEAVRKFEERRIVKPDHEQNRPVAPVTG